MDEPTPCNESLPEPPPRSTAPLARSRIENKRDPAAVARHARKCQICRHRDRDLIEREYLDWSRPASIVRAYGLPERAFFRHLAALGLTARRTQNLRNALERILERGVETEIDGPTILHAVRAYCCLTDDNKWIEPAKNVSFSNRQCRD